jgi:hypothetical protein
MSKRKPIGLQNRLEIIIQAMLDYDEEGGHVTFDVSDGRLVVEVEGVCEEDGRFLIQEPEHVEVE